MSKKDQLENLAIFIGLKAAHEIMIKLTNKPESINHLEQEADIYDDLSIELSKENWNKEDILEIKEITVKRCNKKLGKYSDISDKKYNETNNLVDKIMIDLNLK